MQKQKRVTDFFSSPVTTKKSISLSPRTPLFELNATPPLKKRPRLSIDAKNVKQRTLDAGQRNVGGQYCKQVGVLWLNYITLWISHPCQQTKVAVTLKIRAFIVSVSLSFL